MTCFSLSVANYALIKHYELVYNVESCVFSQALRNHDPFRSLEILEECRYDARERKRAAVERVAEMNLLVGTAIAAFQSVGLISLEVGYGADLKPTLLSCAEHFEVEGDG